MTVAELIKILETLPQNAEVWTGGEGGEYPIEKEDILLWDNQRDVDYDSSYYKYRQVVQIG